MPHGEMSYLMVAEKSNVEEANADTCKSRCPKLLIFFIAIYLLILAVFLSAAFLLRKTSASPHVILIIADDLGWADVEWNDWDMRTPALKALLANGVFLNNSYAHPMDSPSRAALFTGVYPFHMGLQHETMDPSTPTFVPANVTLLSERLKNLDYKTHLLGKWHLGFCNVSYTPNYRGFSSFTGFYTDTLDYYSHRDDDGNYDFRTNEMVDYQVEGTHSTQIFADQARDIIRNHDIEDPLFLAISFQAVHSPAQVPQNYFNQTCSHVVDKGRRKMCAITAMMDEAIGNVTSMLEEKNMLDQSIIIVTSDNGGVVAQSSSNRPFRGEHGDLYEGGTRVMTLLSSQFLSSQNYYYSGLFHQVDWVPTILSAIGYDRLIERSWDGVNHWHALRTNSQSPRTEIVYNIDETYDNAAIRVDDFKLIEGSPHFTHPSHDVAKPVQLYDLSSDRGETNNLAEAMPDKVESLRSRLKTLKKGLVPAVEKEADPKSVPDRWNGVWSPGWC